MNVMLFLSPFDSIHIPEITQIAGVHHVQAAPQAMPGN